MGARGIACRHSLLGRNDPALEIFALASAWHTGIGRRAVVVAGRYVS